MSERSSSYRRRKSSRPRPVCVTGGASRRLRLEGMEGRLMLSTIIANIDFSPLNLTIAQFSLDSSDATPGTAVSMALPSEGGFIETPYSSVPRVAVPDTGTPVLSVPEVTDSNVSQPSTPSGDVLNSQPDGDTLINTSTNISLGPAAAVDAPVIGGFDLRPSVIPVWEGPSNGLGADSIFASSRQGPLISDEGGPIQIESMLASIASLAGAGLGTDAADTPSDDASDAGDESLRLAANSPTERGTISGELARAMAFELAGGEPAESQRGARIEQHESASTHDGNPRPVAGEPLSTTRESSNGVIAINDHAITSPEAIVAGQTASIAGSWGEFTSGLQRVVGHAIGPFLGLKRVAGARAFAMVPVAAVPLDPAREEAFDEIAAEKVADGSTLGLEFSWRGALNATPLLLILALERIAASNSRRANREERAPTALPLRRPAGA